MRSLFLILLLTSFLGASCVRSSSEPPPSFTPQVTCAPQAITITRTSPPPTRTATTEPQTPSPTLPPPTQTGRPTATPGFKLQSGISSLSDRSLIADRSMIAFEAGSAQNKTLLLADPVESTMVEYKFPATAHFATPFLAGLSPDARYFVYFEGGTIENLYGDVHLRLSTPDLVLHVLDLQSGEIVFSTSLLSPSFPQDLEPIAETIKDDWNFTFQNAAFEEVVAATEELLLDRIRNVAWSPDGSLLAYPSQDPGPSSDLYFFSPESKTARQVTTDPGHVLQSVWAPDSSALVMETSLYERHAREDTTYLLSRDGSLLGGSFTSQIVWFHNWHNPKVALLYGSTDAGDYFDLKTLSADDGSISMLWEGSWGDIAFTPDLSIFLVSSFMPNAPIPPHPGLFLGRLEDGSLLTLSDKIGWGVTYWGSEHFAFAASSIDGGTIGVTMDGDSVKIDDGYWRLTASPNSRYLVGYNRYDPDFLPGTLPGLRVFDASGQLLESVPDVNVLCVGWNAASTQLSYQAESRLYLWDAVSGSIRLISDKLSEDECTFKWVQDNP